MWINYIGEIGMGLFVLLIVLHFAQSFIYKAERIKRDKQKLQAEKDKAQ